MKENFLETVGKPVHFYGYGGCHSNTMPENPNIDPESGSDIFFNANVTMAATTNNNNNNNRKQGVPRVSSAGIKYYDIATQLLGKAGSDLEELFIAAARDGVFEKIENFLQRNRTDYVVSIDVKDKKTGNTPLIWAAKRGHAKIVQLLLKHGADITLRNYEGHTAVEVASPSIRSILLESVERSTEASHQLLLQAAWQGDIQVVSRLLCQKKVLDINCKSADGYTPVMLATRDMQLFEKLSTQMSRNYNPVEVVTELLSARADLHATDGDGKTCLHHASQSKAQIAQSVLASIISGEPNLEQKDKRCFAPLHCASLTGNAECISTLLDGGSDVNSRGFAGATALHITSYNNHEKATTVLLEHGANVTLTDDRGLTPLDFAKTRKMKKKLFEAWTEVKTAKSTTNLGPIRAHSREDLRSSVEDLTKRRKGEVIFEGLPNNPFSGSSKTDPITNAKGIKRHQSLKEKCDKGDDECSQPQIRDNVRKLGQVRNQQKPSPLPRTKSRSTERLPIISPDSVSSDRNSESPVMFGRNSRARRSFEDRKQGRSRRVNPLISREDSVLGDDVFDMLTPGPPSPTPSLHRRSESDPNRVTPNLLEIAASCEPYLHGQKRGQILSKSKAPMQPMYGTGSSKVIAPTPTFITQRCDGKVENEFSPRSDEGMGVYKDQPELVRSRTIFKDEFVLEESRPKDPFIRTPSTGSDTVSSSGSSHLSSSSRDSPLSMKSRTSHVEKTNCVKPKQKRTGNSANIVSSVKIAPSKLNEKSPAPTANGAKGTTSVLGSKGAGSMTEVEAKVGNSVPKVKVGNSVTVGHSKHASVLHTMAMRNAAVQNSTKDNSSDKDGAKGAGTIVMHANVNDVISDKSNTCASDSKDSNGNLFDKKKNTDTAEMKSEYAKSDKDTKSSESKVSGKMEISGNAEETKYIGQPSSARNKAAQKQMKNVLQVVPTKLTANIIRTVPKGICKDEKIVSDKVNTTAKPQSVSNVNMQLSPSAEVHNRVSTKENVTQNIKEIYTKRESAAATPGKKPDVANMYEDKTDIKVGNEKRVNLKGKPVDKLVLKVNEAMNNSHQTNNTHNSQNQSVKNKARSQSSSAQIVNRQSAQSRNATFNSSKSAGVNQRQMGNVRKTSSSYTPRFQSCTPKPNSSQSNKTDIKESRIKTSENVAISTTVSTDSKTMENQAVSATVISANSSSPTELVPASVNRSASILKSYNMAGVPNLNKSSNSGSISLETSATATKSPVSDKTDKPKNIHSVVSKSVSEPLTNSSSKMYNASIVSKSVSRMPSVGTVVNDRSQNKGLLRSSSMSTIEETKEKKLMSSSDTKIECAKQPRPSSDGPAGLASAKETTNNVNIPLVEIMPECAPRIIRKNYLDMTNCVTTPVIVNPFEELEQKRALTATEFGFVVDKPTIERSRTQVSIKAKNAKSPKKSTTISKPSSASTRGSSATKKRSRSKDAHKSDSENSRPKSGKSGRRVRSGKRKRKVPENLAKKNEQPNVALIGGIGWQIATSCIDKSEADAVIVSQIDSSESDGEDVDVTRLQSQLHINIPDTELQVPNVIDTPSSVYSPRFREVRPNFEDKEEDLPIVENDGYRPMNLDMTQNSLTQQNRAGVIIKQDMPGDISDFLSKLREDENEVFENDIYEDYDDGEYDYENDIENVLHREVAIGQLTPIPESLSLTHTQSTLQRVAKTVDAINRFDQLVKDDDLGKLLGSTPREKLVSSYRDYSTSSLEKYNPNSTVTSPLRNSGGSVRSLPSQTDSKQSLIKSAVSRTSPGRNSSSKTAKSRTSNLSTEIKERANKVFGNSHVSPRSVSERESYSRSSSVHKNNSTRLKQIIPKEKLDTENGQNPAQDIGIRGTDDSVVQREDSNFETKERIELKILDLKKLLAEKMQSTQKLLEESTPYSSYTRRKQSEEMQDKSSNENSTTTHDVKINIKELTEENLRTLDSSRTDDDVKSTKSSRKERRFSETKKVVEKDEDMNEAIDEILSNTFPSSRSTIKFRNSFKSGCSTLTEADRTVLKEMSQKNQASPFHAKQSVRASSSYDESVTLNQDNPNLLRRFHAENYQIGQKVKAMIDAGADKSKVQAMVNVDNEAKQLAKIMNSFRQMELYAGPHSSNNRSSKKETPRKEGEHAHKSLSRFDNVHNSHQAGIPPRPGSAGASRMRPGKFTEIKGEKSASHAVGRTHSPVTVPKDLADEFKRSPFKQVSSLHEENIDDLANVIKINSQSSEEDHICLQDEDMERCDSACTSLSSHSSIMEETIQWKKGNVLGKGAFGTVWCGLTSEGQLIAVKQIELNTTNQTKAKTEYEKVQEEVELLKTLEHKNIVGYLGTSLEDSIVSIFMQFVPGGSIASILARFGALDEAVYRKYTKQILEGVQYLHDNDVIHRDIKGGNVMLMPNGVIKLIDFGCAKRLCINLSMGQSQILKSMKGTPYWMAPEVVNETGHGKKSDIWSVGCTVFEMATRKPPWADMNPMAAIFAIGSDKPVPQLPDKFTEEARDFVNCCLTKDQSKRLSATELLQTTFMKRRSKKSSSSNC